MIINLPTKRISVTSEEQTFLKVLPTRWRWKRAGIDMERNYVTVTLCIESRVYLCVVTHDDVYLYRAKVWNSLPPSIVHCSSLATFRNSLNEISIRIYTKY